MIGKELIRKLTSDFGCEAVRQKGSHVIVRCGDCQTVIAVHGARDIPRGTLRSIERDLEPCLGRRWLQ